MFRIARPSFLFLAAASVLLSTVPVATQQGQRPSAALDRVEREVLVKFRRPPAASERAILHGQIDAEQEVEVGGIGVHRFRSRSLDTQALTDFFRLHPDVEYVEPNYIVHSTATPNDPSFGQLWGLQNLFHVGADIGAVAAWDVTTGSSANVVAVIDTGVDYTHQDLAANVWSAPASFTVTIGGAITCAAGTHGFNAITRTCDPMDDHYHGTHVSGTIGAVGNNAVGVVGVNWTTKIMGAKFLDSSGSGSTADAIDAIEFVVQAKKAFAGTQAANVRVLSNSWGGASFSRALLDEINRANTNGMLFIAAAGNAGSNNDLSPFYPASYDAPNVVAVAATDSTDFRASFSNYGATSVDLGAPGVSILSTMPGNKYGSASGTSMATPHVAGGAALVLSQCGALDTAGLKNVLLSSVDHLATLTGLTVTGGRLNVNNAVRSCASAPPPPPPPPPSVAPPSAPATLTATTGPGAKKITLSWTSSAGASSYTVARSQTSGGPYTTVATGIAATTYQNSGLANGTTYYYVVKAVNSAGESAFSSEAAGRTR